LGSGCAPPDKIQWHAPIRAEARPILQLQATEEEVLELGRLVRGTKVSVGDRFRARIILLRLEGRSETEVARTLGCSMGSH
jgi:DNA-directed RNA polymerase specialized sigma24 family protein